MDTETGEVVGDDIDRFLLGGQTLRSRIHAAVGKVVLGRMQEKLEPGNRLVGELELESPLAHGAVGGVQYLTGYFRGGTRELRVVEK